MYGLNGNGAFVKNIVVQNCQRGFYPSHGTTYFDCVARHCTDYGYFCYNNTISFIRCKALNNSDYGFYNYNKGSIYEDCHIEGNRVGILKAKSLRKCCIYNNNIGVDTGDGELKLIEECVISGNDSIGVYVSSGHVEKLSNNIIGLTDDQQSAFPNGIGVYATSQLDTVLNNVISGNRKEGIWDYTRSGFKLFKGNYIGTNKKFDADKDLGNKGDGYIPNGSYGHYVDVSDNYWEVSRI